MASSTLNVLPTPGTPLSHNKPTVIGIYGVSGSGKSYLLDYLKQELGGGTFEFYEGSEVIGSLVPGGLEAFKKLDEEAKIDWRRQAIEKICLDSVRHGTTAVVTGHFKFWSDDLSKRKPVYTKADMLTYTHIIYLDVPAQTVLNRCRVDTRRARSLHSVNDFQQWQESEVTELRKLCRQHGILFLPVAESPNMQATIAGYVRDFQSHSEMSNSLRAQTRLDEIIIADRAPPPKTALVVDGDRTLTVEDTGALLWDAIAEDDTLLSNVTTLQKRLGSRPLKTLFDGPLKYSYTAFRQAVLLYEETVGDEAIFDAFCDKVASRVKIHPEFRSLLRRAAETKGVAVVVVTCGVRRVWEKVLEKESLSRAAASVIGGGRITDGFVVDAQVKADIVKRLRETCHTHVRAFGDSPLDLPMLRAADEAFVVVGDLHSRSKTMDAALQRAVDDEGLKARQLLLPPSTAILRLDAAKLPVVEFTEGFIDALVEPSSHHRVVHGTGTPAANLLMAQMRNAGVYGPALQHAHSAAGRYLATQFVSEQVGLETFDMPHVQGKQTPGHRLLLEQETTIIALMRGGEPMALGVWEAFRCAAFVHAKEPADIKPECLRGGAVLLVDAVVNTGKTIVEFREHLRGALGFQGRIVVVAGVVQAKAVRFSDEEEGPAGLLGAVLEKDPKVSVVALRKSENEYKGKGVTDTGNRLFNTTFLD